MHIISSYSKKGVLNKRRWIQLSLIALYLSLTVSVFSQQKTGDIEAYLNELIQTIPGSNGNDYVAPNEIELLAWSDCISFLLEKDLVSAREQASSINYQIIEYSDNTLDSNNDFYIIQEQNDQSRYWGTYVFCKDPLRKKLIIQIPHPLYDSNTGYQGIYCFKRLLPGALFISGTHRCNNTEFSDCSGTTSACGDGTTAYRISDAAHNVNSAFQKTTEIIFQEYEESVFVQLHGFAKNDDDPYVIMSNGTRVTPEKDYLSLIKDQLWLTDPGLTFKLSNIDQDWSRLIAFTNTQGRFINNSSNPCSMNATNSEGRFVHIEQEKVRLRSSSSAWNKMYIALSNAFPAEISSIFEGAQNTNSPIHIYPNPSEGLFYLQTDIEIPLSVYDISGIELIKEQIINPHSTLDMNQFEPGIYYVKYKYYNKVYSEKIVLMK